MLLPPLFEGFEGATAKGTYKENAVTQPGCVCREKCSCPFRSKKSGQRHPNIARSKIGKTRAAPQCKDRQPL